MARAGCTYRFEPVIIDRNIAPAGTIVRNNACNYCARTGCKPKVRDYKRAKRGYAILRSTLAHLLTDAVIASGNDATHPTWHMHDSAIRDVLVPAGKELRAIISAYEAR